MVVFPQDIAGLTTSMLWTATTCTVPTICPMGWMTVWIGSCQGMMSKSKEAIAGDQCSDAGEK